MKKHITLDKASYSAAEVAKILNKSVRWIKAMLKQDEDPKRSKTHFPNAYWCECGCSRRIPLKDVQGKIGK